MHVTPGTLDLGDIYDLDASMVRRRTLGCNAVIHCPPFGEIGSQGRWYFVTCGKKVGIFNNWYVHRTSGNGVYTDQLPYREEVRHAVNGVSGGHQERVKNEATAYTFFKKALLNGRVTVTE